MKVLFPLIPNVYPQTQSTCAGSIKCAITMLSLFIVLCVHMPVCVRPSWLDCSHPPMHPIATIATDGAAGINAPGSASLINGRLMNHVIFDVSLMWLLTPVFSTPTPHPPHPSVSRVGPPSLLCCQCMSTCVGTHFLSCVLAVVKQLLLLAYHTKQKGNIRIFVLLLGCCNTVPTRFDSVN